MHCALRRFAEQLARRQNRDLGQTSRPSFTIECLLLARNRPGAMSALQPLSGGKRTHCGHVATAVFDPIRTSGRRPTQMSWKARGARPECAISRRYDCLGLDK
jgi:hypothetical protein